MGVLADTKTADTILTRLFYEYTYNRRYFALVDMSAPFTHSGRFVVSGTKNPDLLSFVIDFECVKVKIIVSDPTNANVWCDHFSKKN